MTDAGCSLCKRILLDPCRLSRILSINQAKENCFPIFYYHVNPPFVWLPFCS
uniref:Uncharacterized protein n=1 Tax=Rhizophora mucronata TaxID=61149 RepID=A0A2P2QIR2_RHIMU